MAAADRILLTGATGYLGSHLLRALVNDGHQVVALKRTSSDTSRITDFLSHRSVSTRDLDKAPLEQIFGAEPVNAVLHCATDYGRTGADPQQMMEANLTLPLRLLTMSAEHGVKYFINTDTLLDRSVSPYALSKKQFLDRLKEHVSGVGRINVALEHFYGPAEDHSKFVARMINDLVTGVAEIDLTAGEQKRDFIHVDDVVDAFRCIIRSLDHSHPPFVAYQVGSGASVSIRNLCEMIKKISGNSNTRLNFGAIPYRKNEVMASGADLTALASLGWAPKIGLEEGLKRVIEAEKRKLRAPAQLN